MTWAYEGNEGYLSLKAKAAHTAIYRAWNGEDEGHFYTTTKAEYDALKRPYRKEGRIGYVAKNKDSGHTSQVKIIEPQDGELFDPADAGLGKIYLIVA